MGGMRVVSPCISNWLISIKPQLQLRFDSSSTVIRRTSNHSRAELPNLPGRPCYAGGRPTPKRADLSYFSTRIGGWFCNFLPARRSKRGICYGDVAGWLGDLDGSLTQFSRLRHF